nr:MAG TPA: hypothetical protein [Caudoviricetes sp.]
MFPGSSYTTPLELGTVILAKKHGHAIRLTTPLNTS